MKVLENKQIKDHILKCYFKYYQKMMLELKLSDILNNPARSLRVNEDNKYR